MDGNNRFTQSPYQYDVAGNMTHDASHSYTYDAENHITKVDGVSTATYGYDVDGRRVSRVVAGVETDYIYDLSGHAVATYGGGCGSNCWNTGFIYLNGQMVAQYWGSTYFVHTDHLGSTRLLTGYPTASVAECDDYYPFGESISCGGSSITTHKFTGKERDSESNLDNFGARYDSSAMGRFMSPDPAGNAVADPTNPQSWNLYAYVQNSPLNFIDPSGLECVWDNGSYDSAKDSDTGSYSQCSGAGGTWIDHSYFQQNGLADWSGDPNQDIANIAAALQANDTYSVTVYGDSPQYFISADPDWFHSVQYDCIGEGAKAGVNDFLGGLVFKPEIDAAFSWFDSANTKNAVKPLASAGTAVDLAQRGAGYVAQNRGIAKGIKSAVRSAGAEVSANEVQRVAGVAGKMAAVAGAALSAYTGYRSYKTCRAR